jgi:hypothetical protein
MKLLSPVSRLTNFALVLTAFASESTAPAVTVNDLRCEYRHNPLGIDAAKPRLWLIHERRNWRRDRGI